MTKLNLCVDGHEFEDTESDLAGDGAFPPFYVFNIDAQSYLPGQYATRTEADFAMMRATLESGA